MNVGDHILLHHQPAANERSLSFEKVSHGDDLEPGVFVPAGSIAADPDQLRQYRIRNPFSRFPTRHYWFVRLPLALRRHS